ncbi:ABC transporter permease [Cellulomonas chengniuliangii]|uniref:FtsX-like permease family protein n=1 Tax=Cellulomonas chengniuliangii TaxID=2968084 RepID=A0ABY5KVU0_9CELL|nr:ABC transporter permease [Cellulomonas chengniuliangii]MCC2310051.1 FtsX-like permease family protein [Cellulomonas chengniuliangii]UUI74554.1 FtsX-like permease family protein [Cellulomonas chengniuliangii]
MRRSVGRLAAGGIAIAIGTAFVAATLLAGAVMTRASYDAITASLARADLVTYVAFPETIDRVAELPAVEAVHPATTSGVELHHGSLQIWANATPRAPHRDLEVQTLVEGSLPAGSGEIALPGPMAERLKVSIGDEIEAPYTVWVASDAVTPEGSTTGEALPPTSAEPTTTRGEAAHDSAEEEGDWESASIVLRVVGLLDDPLGAYTDGGGAAVISVEDTEAFTGMSLADMSIGADALIVLAPGADVRQASAEISAISESAVLTKDEAAEFRISKTGADGKVVTQVVLAFAAVALIVAALVISNTFQVLVAQRTRTLALLRCVGAGKRQLRSSVLIEATLLGGISSIVGIVSGTLLAQVALTVLRSSTDTPLPATVSISPSVVLAPLIVGTAITVLAALMPARAATRVAPIAALRPADTPMVTSRSSRVRLVLASLLVVGGVTGLGLGLTLGTDDPGLGLALGLLGGAASFVGFLLGSVFWVPRVVSATGRLLSLTGSSAKLAAANTGRNPRRTAATSTALLIGVTLVAMMSTGAASARSTLAGTLDSQYPVDVLIATPGQQDGGTTALPSTVEATLRQMDDVADTVPVHSITVEMGQAGSTTTEDGAGWAGLRAIDAADANRVMRTSPSADQLRDGAVVMNTSVASRFGVSEGDMVPVAQANVGGLSSWSPLVVQLEVVVADIKSSGFLVTRSTFAELVPDPVGPDELWVRLADVNDAGAAFPRIQDALLDQSVMITGAAAERAQFQQVIDTLLAVVVGLLGVAVVIAIVGVANTLSLSVLERRRESATLRAIGLSRRQLRLTLAIEGVLIAGVGAVLGAVLGLLYGWAGSAIVLGTLGDVSLDVPWRDMGIVVVVALAAGLLASVLPGRSAARTSPVAALAVD